MDAVKLVLFLHVVITCASTLEIFVANIAKVRTLLLVVGCCRCVLILLWLLLVRLLLWRLLLGLLLLLTLLALVAGAHRDVLLEGGNPLAHEPTVGTDQAHQLGSAPCQNTTHFQASKI